MGGSWAGQICPFLAKNSVQGTITLTKPVVHANRDKKNPKKESFRPSWCQQEALIMRPLAVAVMA